MGTLAAGAAARAAMALAVNRARPPQRWWQVEFSGPSFPSRHTTLSTLGAGLTAGCIADRSPRMAWVLGWAPAVSVGASRVVLGVHWPTDVLAGWAYAAAILAASRPLRARTGIARPSVPLSANAARR